MLKQIILGTSLLAASALANAALVVTESAVTGADMAGMEVTVIYSGGVTDTAIWEVVNDVPVAVSSGNASIDAEALSGGAFGQTWELTQAGFTLGAIENQVAFGDFVLSNFGSTSIIGFSMNGWLGNGGVAFDIIAGPAEVTPGSEGGLAYIAQISGDGNYSNQVNAGFNDLFWQLDVLFNVGELPSGLGQQESLVFFADTDLVSEVNAPATIGLLLGSIILFARRSRAVAKI